jgi:hypothetical protein
MVQIIEENRKPSAGQRLAAGLGAGLQMGTNLLLDRQRQEALRELGISSELPPDLQKTFLTEKLKGESKERLLTQKLNALRGVFGGVGGENPDQITKDFSETVKAPSGFQETEQEQARFDPASLSDENILELTAIDPQIGNAARQLKEISLKEKIAGRKLESQKQRESLERERHAEKRQLEERTFHTGFSKKVLEEADQLRTALPKKEMALDMARNAVETGNLGFFSPDMIADRTGLDIFRTAKGAQLITAGKENLLNNMSRISARAQNQWFEQRLNSMFPKIGQSREANLTVQEMLEGEDALDKAYLNEFDRLSDQDEAQFGFIRKDIKKRATDAIRPVEKDILKRTTYRMKEIEELEKGLSSLKNQVGKNVIKGTPLTLAMAKLYKEKFGDKALAVAEKNGYYIPTLEEFSTFQQRPQEFREGLVQ